MIQPLAVAAGRPFLTAEEETAQGWIAKD